MVLSKLKMVVTAGTDLFLQPNGFIKKFISKLARVTQVCPPKKSEKNFSKEGKKVLVYQIRNQIFPFKIQITAQGPSLWEPRTS